jgi:lipopolysaccharide transport system permease protein
LAAAYSAPLERVDKPEQLTWVEPSNVDDLTTKPLDTALTAPVGKTVVVHVTRIAPSKGWVALQLRALVEYRELLYFLVWRDVKVRYKQTLLGGLWAVLQPLLTMVVFSVFFGKLAKLPSDGIPYPIFSFAALVPWTFFVNGLTGASNSLVGSANLIKKVYFPRLAIPVAAVFAGFVDYVLAFAVLVVMMIIYGIAPSLQMLVTIPLLLLATVTSLGVGLWFSALNVKFRDVRYVLPFLVQVWMFATPIAYSSSLLGGRWRAVFALNPMVGVVDGFRWALFGASAPGIEIVASSGVAVVLLISGAYYFRRMERQFADIV